MKLSIHQLTDSTASLLRNRRENADYVTFMSQGACVPAASINKPAPIAGLIAYSANGQSGEWGEDGSVAIKGTGRIFVRASEWSRDPWTTADRLLLSAAQVERAKEQSEADSKAKAAWRTRRSMVRQFIGR